MRRNIGIALLGAGGLLKTVFLILLWISTAIGIWWPIGQSVWDDPIGVIWLVPVGFLVMAFSWWIAQFVYDLIIGMPLVALTSWLLRDEL